jgi:hypothetical protein
MLLFSATIFVSAQTDSRKPKKPSDPVKTKPVLTENSLDAPKVKSPEKKNERPGTVGDENQNTKLNALPVIEKSGARSAYFYEFSQPAFIISQITIEHDENGKGQISFLKKGLNETITDPIQLSAVALERINNAAEKLNFLDSSENYQYEKDYSHLGNIKIKIKKEGRARETKFNYTTNADAKALADEYRKIGQQFLWIFDINLARENQPLESPRLFNALDSLIRRDEVSDAAQMIPFLKELGNDERMPLISRNHAKNLIKQIEKKLDQSKKDQSK